MCHTTAGGGPGDSRLPWGPLLIDSAQRCRIVVHAPSGVCWRSPAAKPGLSDFPSGRQPAGRRVEEEPLRFTLGAAEGEQGQERASLRVEGEVPDPPLFACVCRQLWKPPLNQPQVIPFSLSRSPTLRLFGSTEAEVSRVSQMSPVGWGSPNTVPAAVTAKGRSGVNPCVWPETRLRAPGVDGPKTVEYELSLMAKCCA